MDVKIAKNNNMGFKSIKKELYMIPQTITNEPIGTGNGSMTSYVLPIVNPNDDSLVVYIDGTVTTAYTFIKEEGKITFTTAPLVDEVITADYTLSEDDLILTATSTTIVIGLQICNRDDIDPGAVTIKVAGKHLTYKMVIPPFSALSPVSGKLVLEPGDEVRAYASDDTMLDLIISYMEI